MHKIDDFRSPFLHKIDKNKKTFICEDRLAYVFLGKKKSPAAMQGFSNEVIREEENDPV